MASMGINALQNTILPSIVGSGAVSPPRPGGGGATGTSGAPSGDTFALGQGGKNVASASSSPADGAAGNSRVAGGEVGISSGDSQAVSAGKGGTPSGGAVAGGSQSPNPQPKGSGASIGAKPAATGNRTAAGQGLSQAERREVTQLQSVDARVRAHEQAHLAVAGAYATSGAHFQYTEGPDGRRYAVAGEVGIDTGKESSPEATIRKMETVRAAALAPADPSPQDLKIAATAEMMIVEARQELQLSQIEQASGTTAGAGASSTVATKKPSVAQQAVSATMAGLMRPDSQLDITV